jgi:phosphoribosyl 1,2-cyclic phosphate phosphodiesterase
LRVSVLIQWEDYTYVIDCGPDFRYQMLRANVKQINGILFTHEHADHVAGLDDIRPYCFQMGEVPIYAQQRVLDNLTERFAYIFETENRYPGAPSVKKHHIHEDVFQLQNLTVQPIKVMHGNLPILGYRFGDFAYLTDVKTINSEEKEKLKNLKILVISALRIEPHKTHLTLDDALEIINELRPEKAYLTHISHKLGFHAEVEKSLPTNVFLAYDELEITM